MVVDTENPKGGFVYRGHNAVVTVATFSPSGYWVASGDAAGKVRVWSWDNPDHQLKAEIHALGGAVKDIAWDPESKRIVAAGNGSPNMRVFMWDTGNNIGELVGHTKRVKSCTFSPERPFRIMTASEDMRTIFFRGPPFVMDHSNKNQHSNFVNVVQFSPDGGKLVSGGSDHHIWLYDGKTGQPVKSLPKKHTGSVYGLSWSSNGSKLLSVSADRTLLLWDVEKEEVLSSWTSGSDIGDMMVSCAWAGEYPLAVTLRGDVCRLSECDGGIICKEVFQGHQVSITAMATSPDSSGAVLTGSFDGVVCSTILSPGVTSRLSGSVARSVCGASHSNKISGIAHCLDGVVSVGWDDTIRLAADGKYLISAAIPGQPCGVSASSSSNLVAVATTSGLSLFSVERSYIKPLANVPTSYDPKCVSMHSSEVAVGGSDCNVHLYTVEGEGTMLSELPSTISGPHGAISCVAFSPDGSLLAIGDAAREVHIWSRSSGGIWEPKVTGLWQSHTTVVTCLAWSPNGDLLASGGLDESVYIWNHEKRRKRITYRFVHKDGVTGLCWTNEGDLVSAGNDHCIVQWDVSRDLAVFDE